MEPNFEPDFIYVALILRTLKGFPKGASIDSNQIAGRTQIDSAEGIRSTLEYLCETGQVTALNNGNYCFNRSQNI